MVEIHLRKKPIPLGRKTKMGQICCFGAILQKAFSGELWSGESVELKTAKEAAL